MIDLLRETKELLKDRDQSYRQIAEGSGVGYEWLAKFSQNIGDPRISKVQQLYNYLIQRKQDQAA